MIVAVRPAEVPDLVRVVVGIDPAGTSDDGADETGILVCGLGVDGSGYVLADRSARLTPDGWARRTVAAFDEFQGDRIVAETNYGGDMVLATLRTVRRSLPVTKVTASRGKAIRAEPISSLYEQGRVFHVGAFPELEDQLCGWTPADGTSPDRLDALVWAMTELFKRQTAPPMAFSEDGRRIA
jgi:phage terminase large subunit-like protein